jgi:hypothetical protein
LNHRQPGARRMALLADIGCADMRGGFTGGRNAVMAVRAGAAHSAMLEIYCLPTAACVTIVTIVRAGDVRRSLPFRRRPVMTAIAGAADRGMIDPKRR